MGLRLYTVVFDARGLIRSYLGGRGRKTRIRGGGGRVWAYVYGSV